jgi:hypothetical protein
MLSEGHAFAGVWLQPQEFSQLVTEDVSAVRKRVDLKEMVVFETTLATRAHPPSFTQASDEALKYLNEDVFHAAIDSRRARMQKIRPLALGVTRLEGQPDAEEVISHGFEDAPLSLMLTLILKQLAKKKLGAGLYNGNENFWT